MIAAVSRVIIGAKVCVLIAAPTRAETCVVIAAIIVAELVISVAATVEARATVILVGARIDARAAYARVASVAIAALRKLSVSQCCSRACTGWRP